MTIEQYILRLHEIGAIKFGNFTLKSGIVSPFYIDLRDVGSYPELLEVTANLLVETIKELKFDVLTGIPYTALPFAALVSQKINKPLIYMRKEEKAYGTGSNVVGQHPKNCTCLVIDDLITTGESKIESSENFDKEGIKVRDFVVIIDRSADGSEYLSKKGYNLHSIITLDTIVKILKSHNRLSNEMVNRVLEFTKNLKKPSETKPLINASTKTLNELIIKKKSNLILSLDVENQRDFFQILEKTASEIVMLKTHVDVLDDFDNSFIIKLKEYAQKYDFLIFEDRKFADIGNTVRKQYRGGIYNIADWSQFITVHAIAGEGTLKGLFDGLENRSSFLLARMSSKGNLLNDTYTRRVLEIGKTNSQWVSGFIGHGSNVDDIQRFKQKFPAGMLLLMPGVQQKQSSDDIGQQYISIEDAMHGGADCIIVGRGIYGTPNVTETAKLYRETAWKLFNRG